jgi:hypothetical protein
MGKRRAVAVVLAIVLLGVGVVVQRLHSRPQVKIGVVNITGIVEQFIKEQAEQKLSPAEIKKEVRNFGDKLEQLMREVSRRERIVLLPSEAVIAGGLIILKWCVKDWVS